MTVKDQYPAADSETGSVIFLLPTILLLSVTVLLWALTIAQLYFEQRQLAQLTANCAFSASRAISPYQLYKSNELALSPQLVGEDLTYCMTTRKPFSGPLSWSYDISNGNTLVVRSAFQPATLFANITGMFGYRPLLKSTAAASIAP